MNDDSYYSYPDANCAICNKGYSTFMNESKTCSKRCEFISLEDSEKAKWIDREKQNYEYRKKKRKQINEILDHTKNEFSLFNIELTEDQIRELILDSGNPKVINQISKTIDHQEVMLRQFIGVTTNHHYPEIAQDAYLISGLEFTWRWTDEPLKIDHDIYFGGSRKDLFEWYANPKSFIDHIDGKTFKTDTDNKIDGLITIVQARLIAN